LEFGVKTKIEMEDTRKREREGIISTTRKGKRIDRV
jgi:hypothetical protein